MSIQFIVVANQENRRVTLWQQALENLGVKPATIITYSDLIAGRDTLERFNQPHNIIRFDSPEKNFEVAKALIAVGAGVSDDGKHQRLSAADVAALEFDKGRILYPRQWYLGWRYLLQQWEKQLNCPTINHPTEIATMFDKPLSHQLFVNHGIPVAPSLGTIGSYQELRQVMESQSCHRVFVKLSHGSSASGVVAYQTNSTRELAITTVERVHENSQSIFYNSRKIRRYSQREAIADIIDTLCKEGVQVEQWLPKARLQNRPFDLRVVVIAGQAQHLVVRLGKSPMTNLHLGSDRGVSKNSSSISFQFSMPKYSAAIRRFS
ncbi:MAG: hypothetical protein F6K41_36535, partial [Symploca sp. SIO3E6]|nr:hypothetical protein [Caldora sp. SIO3E6]